MQWLSPLVQLHPVARPTVCEGFLHFPAWRRSVSAILYCLLCFEHWIAPQGWVREWLRLNILATVLIGTAVLLTGPVVTALLHNLYEWTDAIVKILIKVASMLSVLPPLILAIVAGLILWTLFRRRRRGQVRPQQQNPNYYE
jgi:hypothetical protein